MKRSELEKFLGKKVEIKLFDEKRIVRGFLRKSGDKVFINNPNLYYPYNYYFLTANMNCDFTTSCLFKCSHVKSLKEV